MSKVTIVLKQLRNGATIDGMMVSALIKDHANERKRMVDLHGRYIGSKTAIPIYDRKFQDTSKINRVLTNDFFSDIVDTKVGYFVGIPITYTYREPEEDTPIAPAAPVPISQPLPQPTLPTGEPLGLPTPSQQLLPDQTIYMKPKPLPAPMPTGPDPLEAMNKKIIDQKLQEFCRREDMAEVDAECAKFAAICGYGARLCYIGEDGVEHIQNVYPWECIFLVDDNDIQHPEYCLRYWEEEVAVGDEIGNTQTIYKCEFYDAETITYFKQVKDDVTATQSPSAKGARDYIFILDPDEPENPRQHMFIDCPVIGFPNNDELMGDCDKVLSLIDAYDRTISDLSSELEQMRLAYMAIYGVRPDTEFLEQIKKTGTIGFDDPEDRVEFIQKALNDTVIENHLNRLCDDIYFFAGSPNFRDQSFSGQASGVALKFKLFKLETKCVAVEREFQSALHQMFEILSSKWQIEEVPFESDDVEYQFKRNFPINLADEAMTTGALAGMVSEETRLSLLSFVPDPKIELEKMKAEQADQISKMAALQPPTPPPFGDQTQNPDQSRNTWDNLQSS